MIKAICISILLFFSLTGFSQTDTIISKTQKISCVSIKIKEDSVYYKLVDGTATLAISKNDVEKIVYKNGKTFTVKTTSALKVIEGVSNFDDIIITHNPRDVEGYTKIGSIRSKYQHVSKDRHAKSLERPYRILKMQAALKGANIILVPQQKGLIVSEEADTTVTQLYGTAYCSNLPTQEAFEKVVAEKNDFSSTIQWYMHQGRTDVYQLYFNGQFHIDNTYTENGLVYIEGELKSFPRVTTFQLISLTNRAFYLFFELDGTQYNVKVDL